MRGSRGSGESGSSRGGSAGGGGGRYRGGGGGRSRSGGGRSSGGGGRSSQGGGRRGGRGGGRRGGGRFGRGGHSQAQSGNQRERIAVESGALVLIDQFMLANPQFIEKLLKTIDAEPTAKDIVVREYGGDVVEVSPGTYRIERDPFKTSILIHPDGFEPESEDVRANKKPASGTVMIDTRCIAMVDRELLDDQDLLKKYQELWFSGRDKACRDLIRDNGGAVRYGFSRLGDELELFVDADDDCLCLVPRGGVESGFEDSAIDPKIELNDSVEGL